MKQLFNLKSYFTFLSRNKVYTAINVFGLSISLMFVIIIGLYTQQEYAVDTMHSKADRIYAQGYDMEHNGQKEATTGSHWYIQKHLKQRYPEIESSCALVSTNLKLNLPTTEKVMKRFLFTDSTFYRIFDFELVRGDRNHVLDAVNSAVVTEETARQLYGNVDPIGKPLVYSDTVRLVITGVARKMEGSSIDGADIIARFENVKGINPGMTSEYMNNATGAELMFLMKPHHDIRTKGKDIDKFMKDVNWLYQMPGIKTKMVFVPLKQLYFSEIGSSSGVTSRGDRKLVNMLFAVEIMILLFSVFNYINLTVAQSGRRAREMATRRLFGSQRKHIMERLILESIVMCLCSLLIAIGLAFAFVKYADKLLVTEINMVHLFSPTNLLVIFAFVLMVGILAGMLPAVFISRSKPIDVVRGTFRTHVKMGFSKLFIILQSAATILLLACSLTIGLQTHHLLSAPLGYDTDNLIKIENPSADSVAIEQFKSRVAHLPFVKGITACQGIPLDRGNNQTMEINGRTLSFQMFVADENYFKVLGLQLVKDYHLASSEGIYVTQHTLQEVGLKPDARYIDLGSSGKKTPIRGVLKDFRIGNITSEIHPIGVWIYHKEVLRPWHFVMKITGDPMAGYEQIRKIYKEVFKEDVEAEKPFVDQQLQMFFDKEIRLSKIVMLFAFIAIVISLLGLIAMSLYFIQQRYKEIAVRKVFGSNNRQILVKLLRTFVVYVLVAFAIAVPVIHVIMTHWLSTYNYRISLSPWIYLAAGAVCMLLSLTAVYFQSRIAANDNPVNHIKDNQ